MGCVYQQGRIWWIKYYDQGKPYYESSGSDKKLIAQDLLKIREGDLIQGHPIFVSIKNIRLQELINDFLLDYTINQRKSLERARISTDHLKTFFGDCRAIDITTPQIQAYIASRMRQEASSATINRELAALKRMFNLGTRCTPHKVSNIPYIPMLQEHNARQGFFTHQEYLDLQDRLIPYLKPLVCFAYYTGWRKSEILNLKWDNIDLDNRIVRLNAQDSKNGDSRMVYLNNDLLTKLQHLRTISSDTQYVFTYNGKPIKTFRGAWKTACNQADIPICIPGRLFHDFRRTAIRNMVRAGVPERVAMACSGHKTRSVFERYNIVSEQDYVDAANKLQVFIGGNDANL